MRCSICGRVLKTQKSRALGYGPVCYSRVFGSSKAVKNINSNSAVDEFVDYEVPGQMSIDDYLQSNGQK